MQSTSDRQPVLARQRLQYRVTTVAAWQLAILLLGFIIVGGGLFSHLTSAWVKMTTLHIGGSSVNIKLYKICHILKPKFEESGIPCPDIALERFFVATTITCLILSVVGSTVTEYILRFGSKKLGVWKFVDLGYHLIAAVLLFIAAVLYIMSAVQIKDIVEKDEPEPNPDYSYPNFELPKYRYSEKLAVGSFTLVQSLLYIVVAIHIAKRANEDEESNA